MSKLKYLSGVIFVLKWSVLYPIDNESSPFVKICSFLWSLYFVSSFILTVMQCVIYLIKNPFDLVEESIIVMNTAVYFSLFMNFILFYLNSDSLVNLVEKINSNFVDESDNNFEKVSMVKMSKLADNLAYIWTISLIASASFCGMLPLANGERSLAIPVWFPYDATKSPLYEISYVWQMLCQINLGIIYASSDMIYPCFCILIAQQFKILACNCKNNFYAAVIKSGIPKERVVKFSEDFYRQDLDFLVREFEDLFMALKSENFQKINFDYFKKNIKHHQMLLYFCQQLNEIMSDFLMTKIIAAFFNITFIAFSLITTGNRTMLFGLSSYVLCASTELLIYTYSGQFLTQNANFLESLYENPWYLCDLNFQKLVLKVQIRVNKLTHTRAGNHFMMTAPSFLTFMKSILSYVAVLKELTSSENLH